MGGSGADVLNGGDGIDTLSYAGSSRGVQVDLATSTVSSGDATGDKISGFESIKGSDLDDQLRGSEASNAIYGGFGDDIIEARGGRDLVSGGVGNDTLTGGKDADIFEFTLANMSTPFGSFGPGHDRVTDFVVGSDQLRLQSYDSSDDITIGQLGADTVITFNHADGSVTLVGVDMSAFRRRIGRSSIKPMMAPASFRQRGPGAVNACAR